MNAKQRARYLQTVEKRAAEAVAAWGGAGDAVEHSMLVEKEIPKLIAVARDCGVFFSGEDREAFAAVFAYLECERANFLSNPEPDHIWLQVVKAQEAVNRA
jgi:hypothetical protein